MDADSAAVVVTTAERNSVDPLAIRWGMDRGLTFESWRAARWSRADIRDPAIAGPTSDSDQDGIGLYDEYLHGLDPFHADPAGAADLKWTRSGQTDVEVGFPIRTGATDIAFQLEHQLAWGDWTPLPDPVLTVVTAETSLMHETVSARNEMEFFRYRILPVHH